MLFRAAGLEDRDQDRLSPLEQKEGLRQEELGKQLEEELIEEQQEDIAEHRELVEEKQEGTAKHREQKELQGRAKEKDIELQEDRELLAWIVGHIPLARALPQVGEQAQLNRNKTK